MKSSKLITELKQQYNTMRAKTETLFFEHHDSEQYMSDQTALIDDILYTLWNQSLKNAPVCLIALGGYGRKQLHPYSDIDILILTNEDISKDNYLFIERFIAVVWDIGLTISQSVHSLNTCLAFAKNDLNFMTNLLDRRYIAGDDNILSDLEQSLTEEPLWDSSAFFTAKLAEQKKRHQKYGNSSYNLEPNIKQGPGGMRDIQTIFWIAKHHFKIKTPQELVNLKFLTEEEYQSLIEGQRFLWQLRTRLHLLSGRHEERLLFEYQTTLAKEQSEVFDTTNAAVEAFMQKYYKTVKEINELKDLLLQLFDETILHNCDTSHYQPINERFHSINDYLEIKHPKFLQSNPEILIEIFLIMAKSPSIKGIRATTIRLLREHRHLVTETFRNKEIHCQFFVELFTQYGVISQQVRLLNRYGILENYLPFFKILVGQMQHDLFHMYTVDRHIIGILQNIDHFYNDQQVELFPHCSDAMKKIDKPIHLYLGAFFHDAGKGQGGDHSIIGAELAEKFCIQHNISTEGMQLITWLVRHHLLMSETAQRMDIYDPDVVAQFAQKIETKHRLHHLYLLTCADIHATNESLWNSWRSSLLRDLYLATLEHFSREKSHKIEAAKLVTQIQFQALGVLETDYFHEVQINDACELWQQWSNPYFLHHSPKRIAWHTAAILKHEIDPLILISPYRNQGGTEIFIYIKDKDYIFSNTTAVLDKLQLSIVEAQIITAKNGYTLDSFIVINKQGRMLADAAEINRLHQLLLKQLVALPVSPHLTKRRISRRLKYFNQTIKITIINNKRTEVHIRTSDRPGLLARIALAFVACNIRLINAKISTLGDQVEDIFFISDPQGNKIEQPATQQQIIQTIEAHILKGKTSR